jgi:hypothetical protein
MTRTASRPNVSRAVKQLIRDVARRLPEYGHVKAERILVVAGEARRASRATVRPMRFPSGRLVEEGGARGKGRRRRRPKVTYRGHDVLYVITLRPLFFRASTPEQRVETILHELFHVSGRFDGTLAPERRHAAMGDRFEAELRPLVKRYLAACPARVLASLAVDGEVLARQWLEKPANAFRDGDRVRKRYTEAQTFLGPVRMVTRQTRH